MVRVHSPSVDPINRPGPVTPLDQDGRADGFDGERNEFEGLVVGGGAGEEAHHVLVDRGSMEPPLEVRGEELVDPVYVAVV